LLDGLAYKLKKPLNLGFLDFSTPEKRRFCCEEELRLNRRLAPDVYLQVLPLCGSQEHPQPGGSGEPFDWLLQMRRFNAEGVLAQQPERLDAQLMRQIIGQIARFHAAAAPLEPDQPYGQPELVLQPMRENFTQLRLFTQEPELLRPLVELEAWTLQRFAQLRHLLEQRREQGHIRECHGDLHLGNMVLEAERPIIFDGIEFNPALRWIDCLNDLAFLLMDLCHQGRADLAHLALDEYLQQSGDFAGVPLLDFYQCYRALVRAKVSAIRLSQADLDQASRQSIQRECLAYIQLAAEFTRPRRGALLISHGLSGSGKSHIGRQLPGPLPLIRLRSDVERKRLAGLAPDQRTTAELNTGLYSLEMTRRTFNYLAQLTESLLGCGQLLLIDATFLKASVRQRFRQLAEGLGVAFYILEFQRSPEQLAQNIQRRLAKGLDASDADLGVLQQQLQQDEPLSAEEQALSIPVPLDGAEGLITELRQRLRLSQ
jgi:aminoglycoside phosphotransferase family enzyme/predicted kinase